MEVLRHLWCLLQYLTTLMGEIVLPLMSCNFPCSHVSTASHSAPEALQTVRLLLFMRQMRPFALSSSICLCLSSWATGSSPSHVGGLQLDLAPVYQSVLHPGKPKVKHSTPVGVLNRKSMLATFLLLDPSMLLVVFGPGTLLSPAQTLGHQDPPGSFLQTIFLGHCPSDCAAVVGYSVPSAGIYWCLNFVKFLNKIQMQIQIQFGIHKWCYNRKMQPQHCVSYVV